MTIDPDRSLSSEIVWQGPSIHERSALHTSQLPPADDDETARLKFHEIAKWPMGQGLTRQLPWHDMTIVGHTVHAARNETGGNTIKAAVDTLVHDERYLEGNVEVDIIGAILKVAQAARTILEVDPSPRPLNY